MADRYGNAVYKTESDSAIRVIVLTADG